MREISPTWKTRISRRRGHHDALDALATAIYRKKVNWIVDADIRAFFDTVSQEWLMRFLEHRIADRRLFTERAIRRPEGRAVTG